MKVFHIPRTTNLGIRRILLLEHAKEESLGFIQLVVNATNFPFVLGTVNSNFVNTFNSIILDNLLRFVVTHDSLSLVAGMRDGTLPLRMDIGHRHYCELISEEFAGMLQSHSVEQEVRLAMANYLNYVYLTNKEEMDAAILDIYETLYNNFGHMDITGHRFVYMNGDHPAAIVTGELNAISQTY